ncbi:MAG: hypothetical protein LUD68_10565 [Rikenellaceae bacterium]|nr:hypothetical protein [Rikenellaceae bacterium]
MRNCKLKKIGLFLLLLCMGGCRYGNIPEEVHKAILLSGNNSSELMKVLHHYRRPQDSLKLQAAYFLIANMPGKYSEYIDAP